VSPAPDARFVALVGNPRRGSRTARLARSLLEAVADGAPVRVVDLADELEVRGSPFGADAAARWAEPLAAVRSAPPLLLVATPTYKGSYTGLLKSVLDHIGAGELRGTVAIPVITLGGPAHALAADVHLRPLLLELGAVTPTRSLVVTDAELDNPGPAISAWLADTAPVLDCLLRRPAAHPDPAHPTPRRPAVTR
jgi:FMN reductase